MNYTQLTLHTDGNREEQHEILMALLGEIGFESFEEKDSFLLAYVPTPSFDKELLDATLQNLPFTTGFELAEIEDQNWNALWESNFEPVTLEGRCHIRAPFHAPRPDMEFDLVIEPKMSFGTAHHETTALMIGFLLEFPPDGERLLDMGSGTGILAILAHKLGASPVIAIDNDEWAYRNALENTVQNGTGSIVVKLGNAQLLGSESLFDTIYANINRNILLGDLASYNNVLKPGGTIYLSGFYEQDVEIMKTAAGNLGWTCSHLRTKNQWTALRFVKQ